MSIAQKKEALRAREASRDAAAAEFERADAINFWQESMKQRLQNRIDEVVEGDVAVVVDEALRREARHLWRHAW